MAKPYLSVPEPFKVVNDNWNDFMQKVKYFFANAATESSQKLHLVLTFIGAPVFKLLSNLIAL